MGPAPRTIGWIFVALAAWPQTGCAPGASQTQQKTPQSREVRVAAVKEEAWAKALRVPGEFLAFEEATVSAKVAGRLEKLAVDLGTRVKKGEELASIDARDYELRVSQSVAAVDAARSLLGLGDEGDEDKVDIEQTALVLAARAELRDAESEHKRLAGLLQSGVVPQAQSDAAEARRAVATSRVREAIETIHNRSAVLRLRRAELASAKQQLSDAKIVAPFEGAVAARLAGTGDYLAIAAPVARLVRFDPIRLSLAIPERFAHLIKSGQIVSATLESGETAATGKVTRMSPEIDSRNRTLRIEAELPNADGALRPGSFVRSEIVLDDTARTRVIPLDALVRFAGIDKVFVVSGGRAAEKRVTVGRVDERRVEILEGLEAGAECVLSPGNLQSGEAVTTSR